MLCFEGDFTVKLYSEEFVERYTGEDGVFGFKRAYEALMGMR